MCRMLAVVALLGLSACALSEERYQERAPEAFCTYFQSCDPPFYDSMADCEDEQAEDLAAPEGCTFDPDAARDCLDGLGSRTCEGSAANQPDACGRVYDCSGADDTDGGG